MIQQNYQIQKFEKILPRPYATPSEMPRPLHATVMPPQYALALSNYKIYKKLKNLKEIFADALMPRPLGMPLHYQIIKSIKFLKNLKNLKNLKKILPRPYTTPSAMPRPLSMPLHYKIIESTKNLKI